MGEGAGVINFAHEGGRCCGEGDSGFAQGLLW